MKCYIKKYAFPKSEIQANLVKSCVSQKTLKQLLKTFLNKILNSGDKFEEGRNVVKTKKQHKV